MQSDNCIVIYPLASKDINNICNYISIELLNPSAARSFLEELEESFQKLLVFPKMYPIIENPFINDQQIRKMLVKNYIVFYKINNNEIQVIRVMHSRSDYITLLQ